MLTTAGKTFPTARTDGSEAGSACAKEDVDLAKEIPQRIKIALKSALFACISPCK
jgi:hypothetical protein